MDQIKKQECQNCQRLEKKLSALINAVEKEIIETEKLKKVYQEVQGLETIPCSLCHKAIIKGQEQQLNSGQIIHKDTQFCFSDTR